MSADDVWGVGTWHMNQTLLDVEPGSAIPRTKKEHHDKKHSKQVKSHCGTKQPLTMCQISYGCSNTRHLVAICST